MEKSIKSLWERNRALEILTEHIPGGVMQCTADSEQTLLNMSGGFLSMFGYTREEIAAVFHDSYRQMICKEDRTSVASAMTKQLLQSQTAELEYRVRCRNGTFMWVMDHGRRMTDEQGVQTYVCMLMDITKRKEEQEKLRLTMERHQVIMDQTTDIIFEWDIRQDTLDFSSNWEKKFGYHPIQNRISRRIPLSDNIHPEDMQAFIKIMKDTAAGIPYSEAEFRIRSINGDYIWNRIRATTQFDCDQHPIKAVGVIADIDEEKNRNSMLLELAQRDSLTRLYNKNTARSKVEAILAEKNKGRMHALLIVDVDNFKTINDKFGHQCGDAVLSNMAKSLQNLFRSTDIIGRIGGDEFMVFMQGIKHRSAAAAKAKEIVEIFRRIDMPEAIKSELSCSVGIVLYPKDSLEYSELFRLADSTLYQVKNSGKENFAFYGSSPDHNMPFVPAKTAVNEMIDQSDASVEAFVQYAFYILHNAKDIEKAVKQVLKIVGTTYDVSRVYIFETSEDGKYCSNTFEWCSDGVNPEMEHLQNLSFEEDLKGFFDIYDENGVFYCQNIQMLNPNLRAVLESQGIVSVLQCFIKDEGMFRGYIGFDECRGNRYWTKEQVHTLTLITNIISVYLIKHRLKEKLCQCRDHEVRSDKSMK